MHWAVEKIVDDKVVARQEGIMADAYEKLIQAKDDTRAASKVSLSYGQSTDFGREKFTVHITLTCDQNEKMIRTATELGIQTVKELTDMTTKGLFG
jgi:hypothetical protein